MEARGLDNITIYTMDGCPKCMILKEKLYSKHLSFTECKNIEEMKELGIATVPVLKVNDKYLDFKDANNYINQQ